MLKKIEKALDKLFYNEKAMDTIAIIYLAVGGLTVLSAIVALVVML